MRSTSASRVTSAAMGMARRPVAAIICEATVSQSESVRFDELDPGRRLKLRARRVGVF
jgi:hypothetical protein